MTNALSRNWAAGKPPLLAAFAQLAVTTAESVQELLQLVISEDPRVWGPRLPERRRWLALYGDHRTVRHVYSDRCRH